MTNNWTRLSLVSTLGLMTSLACLYGAERRLPRFGPVWLMLSGGYRTFDLNWNTAGDLQGRNPNIFEEMSWTNVTAYQTSIGASFLIGPASLRGVLEYGQIQSGNHRSSEYAGDDRTDEQLRSSNGTDAGKIFNWVGAVGFRMQSLTGAWRLTPEIGYSYNEQELNIIDGNQVIPSNGPNAGPYPGLDSEYVSEWTGPFVAARGSWKFCPRWVMHAHVDYHLVDFQATGTLNLTNNVDRYTQDAEGDAIGVGFNVSYQPLQRLIFHAGIEWEEWQAKNGNDRLHFTDGQVSDTKLNEVNMTSIVYSVGVAMSFR
jgi:hypothetical protein